MSAKTKSVIGDPVVFGGTTLPLSMGIRAGDFVYLSGIVACDEEGIPDFSGDIAEQTRMAMQAISVQLAAADCGFSDIVKVVVYLKNKNDFAEFNAVYGASFPNAPPARTTICADFVAERVLVEVDVVAYKPAPDSAL